MKKTLISLIAALALTTAAYAQNVAGGTGNFIQGGSTTTNNVALGLTDNTTNTSGSTQSMFYTLNTVTLAASSFNAATRGIQCDAWGTTAANANNKDFKITLGSATIVTLTASTANNKAFYTHFACVRTGASTQSCAGTLQIDTATSVGMAQTTSTGQTDTGTIAVSVQSQNTAAAATSGTGNGMACTYLN